MNTQFLFKFLLSFRRTWRRAIMATNTVIRGIMKRVIHRRVGEQSAHWLPLNPTNTVNGKWIRKKRTADPHRNDAPVTGFFRSIHRPMINKSGYTNHDGTRPSVRVKTRPSNRLAATATISICIQSIPSLVFWLYVVIYSLV